MKKITFFSLAILMAISCSDDDNSNTPASLDGTWKLTYVNRNVTPEDFNGDGTASENYLDEIDCPDASTIVFGNGNTAVFPVHCLSQQPYLDENLTYEASTNDVTFTYFYTEMQFIEETTFRREGNTLTGTFSFEGQHHPYIPGSGQFGDISEISHATFIYTKQ